MRLIWTIATSLTAWLSGPPAAADPPAQPTAPAAAVRPSDDGASRVRDGLLEVGGAFGLLIAPGVRDVAVTVSAGRFVADNFELSAVGSVSNVKAAGQSATVWSTLIEPSYHLALGGPVFGVLGFAVGAAYEPTLGAGLAVAPRIGVSVGVGRSVVLTTALSYQYITHSAGDSRTEPALIALTTTLRVTIGVAVRW